MKRNSSLILLAGLAFVICGLSTTVALAHHAFAAQYDRNKPAKFTGPVTKIEWINPHARFFMDVKDAGGKVVSWEVELAASAILTRRGWKRSDLKVGDSVTVDGFRAKDGSSMLNASSVVLSDGKKLFGGSVGGDQPNP